MIKYINSIEQLGVGYEDIIGRCENNPYYTVLIINEKMNIKDVIDNIIKRERNKIVSKISSIKHKNGMIVFLNGSKILLFNDVPTSRGNKYNCCYVDESYKDDEDFLYGVVPHIIDNKDSIASSNRDDRFYILDDEELSQVLKNDTRKERDNKDKEN